MKGIIISSMIGGIGFCLTYGLPAVCIPLTVAAGLVSLGLVVAAERMEEED